MPALREETFPSVTIINPNSPPLPPVKAQVLNACGWPSMLHLHVCSPTRTDLTYPLITPPNPSSIHSWMVRTCLHLNCQILPNSPPTIQPLITLDASSLHLSLIFNPPQKCRLLSPPLFPPSPFWMCIKPLLTRARRDSSMAPLSLDRRRGMLECLSPSDSAISSREPTRSQPGLLICSLALHIP